MVKMNGEKCRFGRASRCEESVLQGATVTPSAGVAVSSMGMVKSATQRAMSHVGIASKASSSLRR